MEATANGLATSSYLHVKMNLWSVGDGNEDEYVPTEFFGIDAFLPILKDKISNVKQYYLNETVES